MNRLLILISGILRLELAKDKYERCGLIGQPIRDVGRNHLKTRYGEYNRLKDEAFQLLILSHQR